MDSLYLEEDLDQKRIQAKELLKAVRAGEPEALRRALAYFPSTTEFRLSNAQLVIARENGAASWPLLQHRLRDSKYDSWSRKILDAVEFLDAARVKELVEKSPENATGMWRKTDDGSWENSLHVAVKRGSLEITKILVESGGQMYAEQREFPPVFGAMSSDNAEVIQYLLDESTKRDLGGPPTYGCGIDIVNAARLRLLDRVRLHLDRDPLAVHRRGDNGETALHWAARQGHIEVVEILIAAGAVIEADDIGRHGGKPLHWAAEREPACVRSLLEHGADPSSQNRMSGEFEGDTPLHTSARQKEPCLECARLLLAAGSTVQTVNASGETVLDIALRLGHDRMVEILGPRI